MVAAVVWQHIYPYTLYIIKLQVYQSPQLNCTYACELLSFLAFHLCIYDEEHKNYHVHVMACSSSSLFYEWRFFFTFLIWNWHLTSSSISYDDVAMDVFMFMHKTGCTHYRGHINDMREMCKQPAIARWLNSQSIIKYTTKGMELRTTATIL